MTSIFRAAVLLGLLCPGCYAQTPMDVQPVKKLVPTGTLGTCAYQPTEKETPFYKKLDPKERETGSILKEYDVHKKRNQYVSWFGIVRGIADTKPDGTMTLLLEQKFFDGMTDCHIMLVSFGGSGDFNATLGTIEGTVVPLTLVRVYGKVSGEKDGLPQVSVEYLRVWPWLTFTFTDLYAGGDKGNREWAKYCELCKSGNIYNPYPDRSYYLSVLGNPSEFGTMPQDH